MKPSVKYIGFIQSSLHQLQDCPKQETENAPEATMVLSEDYAEAAENIKKGDRLIILTWLHQSNRNELKTRPGDNKNAALTGIFSTRSPNRPNPIGIHFVKVLSVLSPVKFQISAIEVLNETPVVDIKPVI